MELSQYDSLVLLQRMENVMKIPCKDCLILPACRCKLFSIMMWDCKTLSEMMRKYCSSPGPYNSFIMNVQSEINPTEWYVELNDTNMVVIKYDK